MKKTIKFALFTVCLIVLLIVLIPVIYLGYDDYSLRHQGELLAQKADAFELKEGHVPETLQEIGERDPHYAGRLSYYALDTRHYVIRYMKWDSSTFVFDSNNRKWEFSRS